MKKCGTKHNCDAMQDVCYTGEYTISKGCVEIQLERSRDVLDKLVKGIIIIRDNHALPHKHRKGTTTPTCERLLAIAKGEKT